MDPNDPEYARVHDALVHSEERLEAVLDELGPSRWGEPSYAKEWSVAQVCSHLGSGAEISSLRLHAGIDESDPPGREQFDPIWERWNAMAPSAQVEQCIAANRHFLGELASLEHEVKAHWSLELFGSAQDLTGLLKLRLGEHAVHTWDVAVIADGHATVAADAVPILLDRLGALAERTGKVPSEPFTAAIVASDLDRAFVLTAGPEHVRLDAAASKQPLPGAVARAELPAEAVVRLVYGRLDADHTPPHTIEGLELDRLRTVFPGY